jgi:hypothetical protein
MATLVRSPRQVSLMMVGWFKERASANAEHLLLRGPGVDRRATFARIELSETVAEVFQNRPHQLPDLSQRMIRVQGGFGAPSLTGVFKSPEFLARRA